MNNLNLIIGEDKELIDFNMYQILNNIDYIDDNKITYDLKETSISSILDESSMMSLISPVKVVIGTNLDISKLKEDELDYLNNYINNLNPLVNIILLAPKVDARIKNYTIFKNHFNIINLNNINEKDNLLNYIENDIKTKGYKINDYDTSYLLSKVGNDIYNINLELSKLYIYKEKEKTITKEDIDLLITDNIDNIIYEFTNAFLEKDYNKITKMYQNFMIQNISFDYLIASLVNTIHQVLIIKMLHNEGKNNLDISKKIGKKEFYVKKMLDRIYQYTEEDLCKYLTRLTEIDIAFKKGKCNYDELELFLLK